MGRKSTKVHQKVLTNRNLHGLTRVPFLALFTVFLPKMTGAWFRFMQLPCNFLKGWQGENFHTFLSRALSNLHGLDMERKTLRLGVGEVRSVFRKI